ncbi:MAG: hypothetical protein V9E81_06890 [Marmoricola sp.]
MDKLIENNRRRVEVLEEMARAIYREWFVKFHYPGHEDVPLVDSPLGRIPEGWVVSYRLGAASTSRMGQTPKSEFYNLRGNGLPFHQEPLIRDLVEHSPDPLDKRPRPRPVRTGGGRPRQRIGATHGPYGMSQTPR